ncbi:hypothetical protein [Cryptosporangium sp. NPDC048952]|uniref:hypothetical protein n=1 Tax=Cryptosporangium sp. NPDC048952 TaxID=3363961 RepID=UPI00371C906E
MSREPYENAGAIRVCMDGDQWQTWVWDGRTVCPDGHPWMEEVDGDGTFWCAQYVVDSYGPVMWFRLEPCEAPTPEAGLAP